jgi:hypothetical protein
MKKILLNTGLFVKKDVCDMNQAILAISQEKVDGIEISTSCLDHLLDFRLSQQSFAILKNMSEVGIVAPAKFKYRNDRYTREVVTKLRQVYDLIQAKYAVLHSHTIEDFSLLDQETMVISLENDRVLYQTTPAQMKALLDEHPNLRVVLNTAHALSVDKGEVKEYVSLLKDKIIAVHLSAREGDMDHTPLCRADKAMLKSLEPVRNLDCPVMIECWHTYKDLIKEEIEFVRNWLG